jgi:hypothetical protein
VALSGGNERANTQLFITDLCRLLEVEQPQPTQSTMAQNDYVFERHVVKTEIDGASSNGWTDLYKRDCFILEAKQGSAADIAAVEGGHGSSLLEWPGALPEQVVAVASVVARSGKSVAANDVARAFKGKRAATVTPVLDALAGMGRVRKLEDGRYAA